MCNSWYKLKSNGVYDYLGSKYLRWFQVLSLVPSTYLGSKCFLGCCTLKWTCHTHGIHILVPLCTYLVNRSQTTNVMKPVWNWSCNVKLFEHWQMTLLLLSDMLIPIDGLTFNAILTSIDISSSPLFIRSLSGKLSFSLKNVDCLQKNLSV